MREVSGRLEEMPGEEGYPAYLPSRIAEFYERAGRTICLGGDERTGTLSVIGAVSPPGGDLSDPVVQATLKVVKVFWSLEDQLAFERHFPAIGWLSSYSLYHENLKDYFRNEVAEDWETVRTTAMELLQKLRGKYRLGLITNASDKETTWRILRDLRLKDLFATILISGEFGWRKPSPQIFNAALGELSARPEYSVMVGDSFEADIIGAKNLGLKTVYIDAENEAESDIPDITIQHIGQLFDRLPEL